MRRGIVLILLGCLLVSTGPVLAQEATMFQLLRGRAALSRTGGSTWLDLGPEPVAVTVDDQLRTEGETRGEIRFPDGSLFRIKSNTLVKLLSGGLQIQVGETWLNLKKQGRNFEVVTPTSVCGVLGTNFDVSVDKFGHTQVRVFEGIVAVRANADRAKRQLVLQRGMMTNVRDRNVTGEQPQKFDPKLIETQMKGDWERGGITPNRPGLPPMRPALPGGFKRLERDGGPDEAPSQGGEGGAPAGAPTGVREKLSFFEDMAEQRIRERMNAAQEGTTGTERPRFPIQPYPSDGVSARNLDDRMMREGHGRAFGQGGTTPGGAQDMARLREEIQLTTSQIEQVTEQIRQLGLELKSVQDRMTQLQGTAGRPTTLPGQTKPISGAIDRSSTGVPVSGQTTAASLSLEQLRERAQGVATRLQALREQQQKLALRLADLRSRLR